MTGPSWDAAIVGVGAMGSMSLWRMAARGLRVIGVEQHDIGHDLGAAGGETRIFRLAYKEGSWYVPLLREAEGLWNELSAAAGRQMLTRTGALTIGPPEEPDVAAVLRAAREHGLRHEVVDAAEAIGRFPHHHLHEGEILVHDPSGGLLYPDLAIRAAAETAVEHGAELRTRTRCLRVEETGAGVAIHTGDEVITARRALICAGPWTGHLFPDVGARFEVRRVVLHWFRATDAAAFGPDRFPVGIRRSGPLARMSFFPAVTDGLVKVNLHTAKEAVDDVTRFDHSVDPEYTRQVEAATGELLSGLETRKAHARAFFEGYTPDNHALIGRPKGTERVLSMSGFSGHGFKMSPVFGEIAAELVADGGSSRDITPFALTRNQ